MTHPAYTQTDRPNRSTQAFTLIELLVTIAILAILASILMPTFYAAMESARKVKCAHQLHSQATALMTYASSNERQLPPVLNMASYPYPEQWQERPFASCYAYHENYPEIPWNLAIAYEGGYLSSWEALYCPSEKGYLSKDAYHQEPWGRTGMVRKKANPGLDSADAAVRTSYYYNPYRDAYNEEQAYRSMPFEPNRILAMDAVIGGATQPSHVEGCNVVAGDGSAVFKKTPPSATGDSYGRPLAADWRTWDAFIETLEK